MIKLDSSFGLVIQYEPYLINIQLNVVYPLAGLEGRPDAKAPTWSRQELDDMVKRAVHDT
jgi:hypothetical protein